MASTTITIPQELKDRLNDYTKGKETYPELITRILDELDKCNKKKK